MILAEFPRKQCEIKDGFIALKNSRYYATKYFVAMLLIFFSPPPLSHPFGKHHQTAGVSHFVIYTGEFRSQFKININQNNNSAVYSITMHNCHLNSPLKKRETSATKNFAVTKPGSHSISKIPPFVMIHCFSLFVFVYSSEKVKMKARIK